MKLVNIESVNPKELKKQPETVKNKQSQNLTNHNSPTVTN